MLETEKSLFARDENAANMGLRRASVCGRLKLNSDYFREGKTSD